MKLSLKNIEFAGRILEEVKKLDSDIIKIDVLIRTESECGIPLTFKLEGKWPTKLEDKKESVIDSDGSLKKDSDSAGDIFSLYSSIFSVGLRSIPKTENKLDILLEEVIEERVVYQVLAIIYQEKIDRRERCLAKLRELGIDI